MTGIAKLLEGVVGAASARVRYADARWVERRTESIETRNRAVQRAAHEVTAGVGVRVLVGSSWGYGATSDLTRAGVLRALERALRAAGDAPAAAVALPAPLLATYRTQVVRDPFAVPLDEKLDLLTGLEEKLRVHTLIAVTQAQYTAVAEHRLLVATTGTCIEQETVECGAGLAATAVGAGEVQQRSYPSGGGFAVDASQAGYEHIEGLDLAARAPLLAEEAVELLTAPVCPAGEATVVIGGAHLALQVHESVGHAVELDRILGHEAAYAGTSFVTVADRGVLRYGSNVMNVTADATLAGGLGTYGFDDEGVAASRVPIVRDGILVGFLSSTETAAEAGTGGAGGAMRADGWARQPIVRMTNVNLEPGGAGSFADLVADTDDGLYLETTRGYSIDDRRLNFFFSTEIAREIRGGELGRLYRNASYTGITPRFWASLDAVCGPADWRLWGTVNCGKGEPAQIARVSHGAAPARFRGVSVGPAR